MIRRVAVIGGGISGLTAAYRLTQYQTEPIERSLFEASNRLGGVIQTDRSHTVVLEGGPDSFLRRKPEAIQLSEELGLGAELMGTNPNVRGSYIFREGRFHSIPAGIQSGIPTQLDSLWKSELLTTSDKIRLMGDLTLPRRPVARDVSLGSLLRYRFGNAYVDRIASPILSGIYAGDIDTLSCELTAPQLLRYQSRGRSLIKEAKKHATRVPKHGPRRADSSLFSSLVRGMGSLVDALERAIEGQVEVHLQSPIRTVTYEGGRYHLTTDRGMSYEATDLVIALPAYRAAEILTCWSDDARQLMREIPYTDLAVIGAVYDPSAFKRSLDKTGFLVPRGEGVEMTAGTWVRSKWAYPDNSLSVPVRAFYGRAGDGDVLERSDDMMLKQFRQEMGYIMGVTDAPEYGRVFRIPGAMPQYLVGHRERMGNIEREVFRWPGLALIGAYFDGVGVPDCIRHANEGVAHLTSQWAERSVPASV